MVKRGEVWLVALDPTVGSEIQKTRPCLVISPDDLNGRLRTAIVVPMTTGSHAAPFRISTMFQHKPGLVLPDQVRTADRHRFVRRLGQVDAATLRAVLEVMREMFAD